MASSPDEGGTPDQTLLAGTKESAADTVRDGMDWPSEITDSPVPVTTTPPREHEERPKLETILVGPQETQLPLQDPPVEEVTGDGESTPPDAEGALCGHTDGKDDARQSEVPAEESEGTGTPSHHHMRQGASGRAPAVRDIEEIGSSSIRDEAAGLRKRQVLETPAGKAALKGPPVLVAEEDDGGITLNKCLLVALVLVGVGFGIFGSLTEPDREPDGEDPDPGQLYKREADGDQLNGLPPGGQAWMDPYPGKAEGASTIGISLGALLDKLTSENQQIRMMHVELQTQKDELESLLKAGAERLPAESRRDLEQLTQHLAEHLSHEESTLSALQDELRGLRRKIGAMGGGSPEPAEGALEGSEGRKETSVDEQQVAGFLVQKENLVAEALMLRQELDKQRGIILSMQQALEGLIERVRTLGVSLEAPKILEGLEAMEQQLSFELERSEIWEKVYGKSKEERKRSKQMEGANRGQGDQPEPEGRSGSPGGVTSDPSPNATLQPGAGDPPLQTTTEAEGDGLGAPPAPGDGGPEAKLAALAASVKSTFARREAGPEPRKDAEPGVPRDPPPGGKHEEWEGKGGRDGPDRKRDHKARQKDAEGHKHLGKDWRHKEHKRQKETERSSENDGVKHRHHEHNKFWKKDQEFKYQKHRYRAPTGCTDVVDCARKEGLDLYSVALEPVGEDQFQSLLRDYVQQNELGGAWGDELEAMAATFFTGGVFVHDQMRFGDFVDDLEDYVEEIAEKLFGDDDAVADFEDYVFRGLLGEAAARGGKKKKHKSVGHQHKGQEGHRSAKDDNHHKAWERKWRPVKSKAGDEARRQMAP